MRSEPTQSEARAHNSHVSRDPNAEHGVHFNLNHQITALMEEDRKQQNPSRTTKMLVKLPDLRIALITMRAGAKWEDHKTDARITVQLLRGKIQFNTAANTTDLAVGHLLVLDPGVLHSVEAIEESAFLLTLVPPHQK